MSTPRSLQRPATRAELDLATQLFENRAQAGVSLAQFTTYRVGGNAALHMHVQSIEDLERVSAVLAQVDLPLLVIGRGSNMLIADTGFAGLAITFGNFLEYIDLPDRSDDASGGLDVEPIALFGGSVLLPVSMRFTAATLNTYDDPAASPVTVTDKAFEGAGRVNVDHTLADARRYCTT
jgi:hypothetical protein